jgi:hypothetical protein
VKLAQLVRLAWLIAALLILAPLAHSAHPSHRPSPQVSTEAPREADNHDEWRYTKLGWRHTTELTSPIPLRHIIRLPDSLAPLVHPLWWALMILALAAAAAVWSSDDWDEIAWADTLFRLRGEPRPSRETSDKTGSDRRPASLSQR